MKNNENIGLQKLKDAFKEINSEELNSLNISKEPFEPSERYKKNMAKLIARQKKPYWPYVNTAGKRAVACILVFIMIFASSMTISAVREPVVEFFVNVYEKFVEIFCNKDDVTKSPDEIGTVYTLGYLPEGYEFESREENYNYVQTVYGNNHSKIRLTQYTLSTNTTFDNEDADFEFQISDEITVAVAEKADRKSLYWNTADYAFKLTVPNEISEKECIRIITEIK
ncbi:MAG: DUF4367 domain-containing protein [Clostridia bacterium]|nr:DUF4367 domain-containing protein [Clostridia bacterium]